MSQDYYTFQGNLLCVKCGADLEKEMRKECEEKGVQWNEDSEAFPQFWPHLNGTESDSPQHCGNGPHCLDAVNVGKVKGREDGPDLMVGCFLENDLTRDGVTYVKEKMLEEMNEVTQLWADYYGYQIFECVTIGCGARVVDDSRLPPGWFSDDMGDRCDKCCK